MFGMEQRPSKIAPFSIIKLGELMSPLISASLVIFILCVARISPKTLPLHITTSAAILACNRGCFIYKNCLSNNMSFKISRYLYFTGVRDFIPSLCILFQKYSKIGFLKNLIQFFLRPRTVSLSCFSFSIMA